MNDVVLARCKEKVNFEHEGDDGKVYSIKAVFTIWILFPTVETLFATMRPMLNIIQYSDDIEADLSHLKVKHWLKEIKTVTAESCRVLQKDKSYALF